jgi:O-antigen/teichoic acid export membrane protein
VLSLAVVAVLTRLLAPADFGLLGIVVVYLAFTSMIVDLGMGTAIIQRRSLDAQHLDAAFWFNVVCGVVLFGLTIALSGPIAAVFKEPRLENLLRWGGLSLVFTSLSGVQAAIFVKGMDFRTPAIRTLAATLGGGVIGIALAFAGFGVWALIGQQLAASIAGSVVLWIASGWRPRFRFSFAHLRDLLAMGGAVFGSGVLWAVASRSDQIFIGRALGTDTLGVYLIGAKLSDMARMALFQPAAAVALPAMASLQDDHGQLQRAAYEAMRGLAVVSFPVFVGLASVSGSAVPLFFGQQWMASVGVLQLLSLYSLVVTLQVLYHSLLVAAGDARAYLVLNSLHAIGALSACIIGVQYSVEHVVVGLITSTLIVGLIIFLYLRYQIRLSAMSFWLPCLAPAIAATLMAIVLHVIPSSRSNVVTLLFKVVVGSVVYSTALCVLSPHSYRLLISVVRKHSGGLLISWRRST